MSIASPHHEMHLAPLVANATGNTEAADYRHARAKTDPNRRKRNKGRS